MWGTTMPVQRNIWTMLLLFLPVRRTRTFIRRLLGQYLVDMRLVTPAQLREALEVQEMLRQLGQYRSVGSILRDLGYISKRQLDSAVRRQAGDAQEEWLANSQMPSPNRQQET